ncbi:glycoside hydrolase family 15 protein [Sanguibacter inulinus]|uniref:Glycoside hydrolase family 15 protein n=1 Tax=Sanguibacter inulinus TaxID=60922 RepID=A0A853EQU9_9MICO|nr:glycoside hydrolase family 15 protein [Sanguibacter inulinus]MBF0721745.1 glycoside hydrolase family 15 protein [Sanguibacter inulinus]NYS92890.1 glycoside hydrolase family 15 protein [Sanguibacter inulinus]
MPDSPALDTTPCSTPIADYAVLGDGRSCALVSRTGSVDWLCLPDFDSPACFAALLGTPENGRWLLTVRDPVSVTRRYLGDSFVLETTYTTATGTARVVDAMPPGDGRADLVRELEVLDGHVTIEHEWVVRFGYGAYEPWVSRVDDDHRTGRHAIRAVAGPDSLLLRGTRLPRAEDHRHRDVFEASEGERFTFSSTWTPSWGATPPPLSVAHVIATATDSWHDWARQTPYSGPYREPLVRSLLVLRLLTSSTTGGIVAAATTSLPEDFGGERNWDYRYCWLRDAAMTLEALVESGYHDEIVGWRDWLLRAVAGDPEDLQIMYGVDGRRDLPERELDHLPGYAGSRPVRVGNAAVDQVQNDVLGEVMCALDMARDAGLTETADSWSLQRHLVDALVEHWDRPDRGIWEVRGPERDFVHSRVMSWAAIDRAVRGVEVHGLDGPVEHWKAARDEIHAQVMEHGFDSGLGAFVQYYGAEHTDASLLQMAQVGFIEPTDERFVGTVREIQRTLATKDGFVRRYETEQTGDGLEGDEAPFLVCSFWLVDALARTGETDEAQQLLDTLVGSANDLGLMAEQYDDERARMAGNFPQAFSHLGLVRAVHSLDRATSDRGGLHSAGHHAPGTTSTGTTSTGTTTTGKAEAPSGAPRTREDAP